MNIVVLDGGTTNPGDISWAPLEALGSVTVYGDTPAERLAERAKDAEAVIVNRAVLSRTVLEALPRLRYIGTLATGFNTIDVRAARERGVTVCNVPLYCAETVAQFTISLLLALCCRVERLSDMTRASGWSDAVEAAHTALPVLELAGKTLGVLGFGSIGSAVARIAAALGMRVLVHSRTRRALPPGCTWCGFETLFAESDVVSLHCPLNDETRGIVGADVLARMKPTALLLNTARGALVDEAALAGALNAGRLAGAGLDVLAEEPPQPGHPLLTAKNCLITPHIAWSSREARLRLIDTVAENLRAYLAGHPINVVS